MSAALGADIPRLYVRPGETVVVARSDKVIALDPSVSPAVKLTTDTTGSKAPTIWIITYTAPPANDVGEVAIGYTEGAERHNVILQVSAMPQADSSTIASAGTILAQMLVIAVVLESAFAVIFNWRVFLEFFDGRGIRTVVMFIGGWIVATLFHQDFVGSLFDAYLGATKSNAQHTTWGTQFLTALVLAGGSASVNQLLIALNMREVKTAESVSEKAPPDRAWVAIKVSGIVKGDAILVIDAGNGETPSSDAEHVVGVMPAAGVKERLLKYFWRDRYRVPMSRGFVVDPTKEYAFVIQRSNKTADGETVTDYFDVTGRRLNLVGLGPTAMTPNGGKGAKEVTGSELTPPPRRYSFAKGAVIDFQVKLPPMGGPESSGVQES
ncbi:hypothetical protein [Mesorhizobium sp.]|uniref:hypothetical protein n=1 Tax=Mesorhizobium sp. TaxID=1871066 RepID=UPI000FE9D264|nr:hypothetical protein [Mesorhizobium sp.]RWE78114.1 MAG: hypothetical protein EOS42_06190 [Mesorhizobium sp.]TIV32535.1 MAG: hypothetical protein E5V90_02565 [Mesorhizobium sp.]